MKEIKRAENAGFCFGVRQAIEMAEQAAAVNGGGIYSMGSLIHNEMVTDDLAKKGISIINDLSQVDAGATVIIRSHGEGKKFYDEAAEKNINLVDATCPFVGKIHKLVYETDKNVIIVGDRNHPEVMGIFGWCDGPATVVDSYEEAKSLEGDDFFVVTQTTIRQEMLDEVLRGLRENNKKLVVNNTICSATSKRQDSCKALAEESDLMIVIGGRNSSNTKKLYEISKNSCINTYFVENIEDLPLKEVEKYNKIGVAAGASTPERIIKEVIARMSDMTLEN
ncbi:MAG: 4-hydroxy-3-methylbut-2-enyl diphosphate reductase, partial [Eubacterium sp.]|nr:4-hydroxy-3-methylbut-2-enyl diphosphate reductase [Candidatus Colimonas fimequi]